MEGVFDNPICTLHGVKNFFTQVHSQESIYSTNFVSLDCVYSLATWVGFTSSALPDRFLLLEVPVNGFSITYWKKYVSLFILLFAVDMHRNFSPIRTNNFLQKLWEMLPTMYLIMIVLSWRRNFRYRWIR